MKFANTSTVTGTLGERQMCSFDEAGAHHIMSILSNIYGNSKAAVLREYAANGLDSHREAGVSLPVEVKLPNPLDPTLVISDYGLGLDREGIENVYSKYGASTKRDSNDDIGGFGIGAKSAFTVASQFTVSAIKDGVQTVVVFSMDNGIPGFTVVSETPTRSGNGVTIQIPAADGDIAIWKNEAEQVFRTWPKGSVLVNGVEPVSIFDDSTEVTTGLWLANEYLTDHFIVSVGGVSYSGSYNIMSQLDYKYRSVLSSKRAIVELPVGSVDIRPDREGLRDTKRTLTALTEALDGCIEAIEAISTKAIAEADTDFGKVKAWNEMTKRFRGIYTPKPPTGIADTVLFEGTFVHGGNGTRTTRNHDTSRTMTNAITFADTVTVVTGEMDGSANRLLPRWRKAHDWTGVLLAGDVTEFGWVSLSDFTNVIDVKDMVAEAKKLPPVKSGVRGTRTISYTVWSPDGSFSEWEPEEISEYGEENVLTGGSNEARRLNELGVTDMLVISTRGSQSYKKMCERIGFTPKSAHAHVLEVQAEALAAITDEMVQAWEDNRWFLRWCSWVNLLRNKAEGKVAKALARPSIELTATQDALITRHRDQWEEMKATPVKENILLAHIIEQAGWRGLDDDIIDAIIEQLD